MAKRKRSERGDVLDDRLEHLDTANLQRGVPSRRLQHSDYYVGWICALHIELTAARVMLDEIHDGLPSPPGDDNVYLLGSMCGHNVVIACLPAGVYGTTSATAVGITMSSTYPNATKIPMLVGIGGGVPRTLDYNERPDIRLGDVVVSTPTPDHPAVVQYDYGKTVGDGVSISKGTLNKPARVLLNAVAAIRSTHDTSERVTRRVAEVLKLPMAAEFGFPGSEMDVLYSVSCDHETHDKDNTCLECEAMVVPRQPRPDSTPGIHYGTVASGNQVIKHGATRDRVAQSAILCFEMEAAGLMDLFAPLVVRGICDYCDSRKEKTFQRYAALTAAALARELLSLIPKQIVTVQEANDGTEKDNATLRKIMLTDPRLDKQRIEATKGGLLRDSYRWVLDTNEFKTWRDSPADILWIRGDPGKGKTMLLCGVVDELRETTSLAYFLCQATNEANNTAEAVLRGLIYMLADEDRAFVPLISSKLDKANNAFDANSWYMLSQMLEDMMKPDTCIVIDALDECDTYQQLLSFILRNRRNARWLISSRNWPEIAESLRPAPMLSLEVNADSVSHAITSYIRFKVDELAMLKNLSSDTKELVREHLLKHANGTFLWVALVCMNLAKTKQRHIKMSLERSPIGLDEIYNRMWQMIDQQEDAETLKRILVACTLVVRPVTLNELVVLLEMPEECKSSLEEVIHDCGSFLSTRDGVIEFVHQTAKEYIDQKSTPVIKSSLHREIFLRSLKSLSKVLKRDLFDKKNPDVSSDAISQGELSKVSLVANQYACVHWVRHLVDYAVIGELEEKVLQCFFLLFYLPWLEAMSWLKLTTVSLIAIQDLEAFIEKEWRRQPQRLESILLPRLVYDARRFLQYFQGIIEACPLQVYYAGLLFSPENSLIRRASIEMSPRNIEILEFGTMNWPSVVTAFNMVPGPKAIRVTAFSFADDGTQISVGIIDGRLQVWSLVSIKLIHRAEITSTADYGDDYAIQLAFLTGTAKILCQFTSQTVAMWDLITDKLHILELTYVLNISRRGFVAYEDESNTVRVVNVLDSQSQDGVHLEAAVYIQPPVEGKDYFPGNVLVFAADVDLIAVQTNAKKIEVWSYESSRLLVTISTSTSLDTVAMALSSKYLVTCGQTPIDDGGYFVRTIALYDIANGGLVSSFSTKCPYVSTDVLVELREDNQQLVLFSEGLYVYDIAVGLQLKVSNTVIHGLWWLSPQRNIIVCFDDVGSEIAVPGSYVTLRETTCVDDSPSLPPALLGGNCRGLSSDGNRMRIRPLDIHWTTGIRDVMTGSTIWPIETSPGTESNELVHIVMSEDMNMVMTESRVDTYLRFHQVSSSGSREVAKIDSKLHDHLRALSYDRISIAPQNDCFIAKKRSSLVICHILNGEKIKFVDCGFEIDKLQWSSSGEFVAALGKTGLALINVNAGTVVFRDSAAAELWFSGDGDSVMIWRDSEHHDESTCASNSEYIPCLQSHNNAEMVYDEIKYQSIQDQSLELYREDVPIAVKLQKSTTQSGQENEDEPWPPRFEDWKGPVRRIRAGDWTEWDVINGCSRRLKYFQPNIVPDGFCFNHRFLVLGENLQHWFKTTFVIRIWDRKTGSIVHQMMYNDLSLSFMGIQGHRLLLNHGVILIEDDKLRFSAADECFCDGEWLWLDGKRLARLPIGYEISAQRNRTTVMSLKEGSNLVLRTR